MTGPELLERCIEARRAYYASECNTPEETATLDAFVDAELEIRRYIRDESKRRDMAARAKNVAAGPLPHDLGTELLRAVEEPK